MLNFGISEDKLQAVIDRVPDASTIWPNTAESLTRESFRERVKGGGGGGGGFFGGGSSPVSSLDDVAIDAVFNCLGGSSSIIVPASYEQVADTVSGWREKPGGAINFLAVQSGIFGARLQIFGAWFFLYIFSTYAGYFVIGRPILYQLFGIDLLPNLKRFWES